MPNRNSFLQHDSSDPWSEKHDIYSTNDERDNNSKSYMIPVKNAQYLALLVFAATVTSAIMPILPAGAIDNPVDYLHLNIPLPVVDVRYFVAGGFCAAASHGVTTPIDVVKTTIQSDPTTYNDGFVDAAIQIYNTEGDKGSGSGNPLLRGLGPTVIG